METNIPLTALNQTLQIKSSPETIAALLNETEEKYLPKPKHWNSKRVYPFWKACEICQKPYPTYTKEQATRNKTCSKKCNGKRISKSKKGKRTPMESRAGMNLVVCAVCKKQVWRPRAWLKKVKRPTCSNHCNGVLRGKEWKEHAHKGRAAWSEETKETYRLSITGEKNPAWKGGITYFRKKGYYCKDVSIKYVRCPPEYSPMARKDGYVMEHRLIMARSLGRPLTRKETVHHINHDPTDNRPENLMLFKSNREHKLYEAQEQR